MTPEVLTLKDYIVAGAAFIGAILGIMNTWNALSQRRVRLRVTPADVIYVGDHKTPPGFSINVVNLSTFPVTIKEVRLGFVQTARVRTSWLFIAFGDKGG